MASLIIRGLAKRFGSTVAVAEVDLEVRPGAIHFIQGPSGSGKTTLLRTLAGFHTPDAGRVKLGDDDVTDLPPHQRRIALLQQEPALWPHLTVTSNLTLPLEGRGLSRDEIASRVEPVLKQLQLDDLGPRRPGTLSGGQQQRVALARALVVESRCLLLDEPLAHLPGLQRTELLSVIREIVGRLAIPCLLVTHDVPQVLEEGEKCLSLLEGKIGDGEAGK